MRSALAILVFCLLTAACQAQPTTLPVQPSASAPTATSTPAAATLTPVPPTAAPTPTAASTSTSTPTITARAEDLKGLRLVVKHPLAGQQAEALQQIIDEFNRGNIWGIQAQAVPLYSLTALDEQLRADLDNAVLPDLVLASPAMIASWQEELNIIIDLSPYIEDSLWGLSAAENADIPAAFWGAEVDQRGVPVLRTAAVLYYNRTWARELGFNTPPSTPEEFRAQACAAGLANLNDGDPENNGLGGWFLERDALTLLSWMQSFDASLVNASTGSLQFGTPAASSTFTYLRRLLDSACAWTSKTASAAQSFSQRRALFYSGTLEGLLPQERIHAIQKSTDDWVVLAYPSQGAQSSLITDGIDGAVFLAPPAERLASWLLLRWLLLPSSQAVLAQAGGTLPVRSSALALMADFARDHPQWAQFTQLSASFTTAPQSAQWRTARRILEDAAWQIFQPYVTPARIPELLALADATLEELQKRQP